MLPANFDSYNKSVNNVHIFHAKSSETIFSCVDSTGHVQNPTAFKIHPIKIHSTKIYPSQNHQSQNQPE